MKGSRRRPMFKALVSFGTRPEIIKLFPIVKKLELHPDIDLKVLHTGQHREMAADLLDKFSIKADYDLDIMSDGQGLARITSKVVSLSYDIIGDVDPDIVFVQGDTTSAFSVALASYYRKIGIAHVEAGLRTRNIYSPWPEEANRKLISAIASMHFAPTETAYENLAVEGVSVENSFIVGNSAIDAVFEARAMLSEPGPLSAGVEAALTHKLSDRFDLRALRRKKIVLVTIHRRESWGGPLEAVCRAVRRLADVHDDIVVVFPVHPNPAVSNVATTALSSHDRIVLLDPLPYFEFIRMFLDSCIIITDSGGIQEEASALGKPTLVARNETERIEAIHAGGAFLVGTNEVDIVETASKLLTQSDFYRSAAVARSVYGDGTTSEKIVDHSLHWLRKRFAVESSQ